MSKCLDLLELYFQIYPIILFSVVIVMKLCFLWMMIRDQYLAWLKEYCHKHHVSILAYCLMTNHTHLIVVPKKADALQKAFKPLHMRYAQYMNRQKGWSGHLWQGRFFSSALDADYLQACVRYVELNPVRAGLVKKAEDYPWSSAAVHCGLEHNALLNTRAFCLENI